MPFNSSYPTVNLDSDDDSMDESQPNSPSYRAYSPPPPQSPPVDGYVSPAYNPTSPAYTPPSPASNPTSPVQSDEETPPDWMEQDAQQLSEDREDWMPHSGPILEGQPMPDISDDDETQTPEGQQYCTTNESLEEPEDKTCAALPKIAASQLEGDGSANSPFDIAGLEAQEAKNRKLQGFLTRMETLEQFLLCPITHELMKDPVIGSDGHAYERCAIQQWRAANKTSPITRESDFYIQGTNWVLRRMLGDYNVSREKFLELYHS